MDQAVRMPDPEVPTSPPIPYVCLADASEQDHSTGDRQFPGLHNDCSWIWAMADTEDSTRDELIRCLSASATFDVMLHHPDVEVVGAKVYDGRSAPRQLGPRRVRRTGRDHDARRPGQRAGALGATRRTPPGGGPMSTDDRARSSVRHGVLPEPRGTDNPWAPGGSDDDRPVERVRIEPPARNLPGGRPLGAVKIGWLIDIDMGQLLADVADAAILAFEDALNENVTFRPIEYVPKVARGLPREDAQHVIAGYEALCDEGCLVIMGPYITDNGLALLPAMARRGVPLISTGGSKEFASEYGFMVGNGGVSEEGALMAGWLRANGHRRVAMLTEISPGMREYSGAFRAAAKRNGLEIVGEEFIEMVPADLTGQVRNLRDNVRPDALAYVGYGYPVLRLGGIFAELDWDPPRVMSSAFEWIYNDARIAAALEGWVGVDQVADEVNDPNPNYWPMVHRFEQRFGRRVQHAMVGCAYDGARAAIQGVANARLLTPEGVKEGLEAITMMPATNGGPRTHIGFGPHDRKGYKGDWLTLRRIVDGVPVFEGLLRSEWPSNDEP
ncbi:MAG: hypothetical protein AMXMBFR46_00330 [Acidimicrobiia bacterium]